MENKDIDNSSRTLNSMLNVLHSNASVGHKSSTDRYLSYIRAKRLKLVDFIDLLGLWSKKVKILKNNSTQNIFFMMLQLLSCV